MNNLENISIKDLEHHFRIVEAFTHADLGDSVSLKEKFSTIARAIIKSIELMPDQDLFLEKVSNNLNIHNGKLDEILLKFEITPTKELRQSIQSFTVIYLIIHLLHLYTLKVGGVKKRLKEIRTTGEKLKELLSPDGPSKIIAAALFGEDMRAMYNSNREENKTYSKENSFLKRIERLNHELEYILKIEDMFRKSKVAEWLQFGQSGRKENLALKSWVTFMVVLWTRDLGRSLSFSKNVNSGREKFLQFSESCFEHVHSELRTDSVRNAYEYLRSNGKFDYLFPIVE